MRNIDHGLRAHPPVTAWVFHTHALLTTTSPVFSEVTFFYRDDDFGVVEGPHCPSSNRFNLLSQEATLHRWCFEVFRTMRKVRDFQLCCVRMSGMV